MNASNRQRPVFDLSGGCLCLDLANTLGDRPGEGVAERLGHYSDLIAWGRQTELLQEGEAGELERRSARRPAAAAAALGRAIELREAIYRIFSAAAAGRSSPPADLTALNGILPQALAQLRLEPAAAGYRWGWRDEGEAFERILWQVVRSAAELLTSADLGKVRECASPTCGCLFLDRSRNRSRRWCDMKTCGNRSKVRRHYRRRKSAG